MLTWLPNQNIMYFSQWDEAKLDTDMVHRGQMEAHLHALTWCWWLPIVQPGPQKYHSKCNWEHHNLLSQLNAQAATSLFKCGKLRLNLSFTSPT